MTKIRIIRTVTETRVPYRTEVFCEEITAPTLKLVCSKAFYSIGRTFNKGLHRDQVMNLLRMKPNQFYETVYMTGGDLLRLKDDTHVCVVDVQLISKEEL